MDLCEIVKGLVNVVFFDMWMCGWQDVVKNFGVDLNIFENVIDVWMNVMNDENKVDDVIDQVKQSNLVVKDVLLMGNVVWKVLKKIDGMMDEECMVLMLLVGSMIFLM